MQTLIKIVLLILFINQLHSEIRLDFEVFKTDSIRVDLTKYNFLYNGFDIYKSDCNGDPITNTLKHYKEVLFSREDPKHSGYTLENSNLIKQKAYKHQYFHGWTRYMAIFEKIDSDYYIIPYNNLKPYPKKFEVIDLSRKVEIQECFDFQFIPRAEQNRYFEQPVFVTNCNAIDLNDIYSKKTDFYFVGLEHNISIGYKFQPLVQQQVKTKHIKSVQLPNGDLFLLTCIFHQDILDGKYKKQSYIDVFRVDFSAYEPQRISPIDSASLEIPNLEIADVAVVDEGIIFIFDSKNRQLIRVELDFSEFSIQMTKQVFKIDAYGDFFRMQAIGDYGMSNILLAFQGTIIEVAWPGNDDPYFVGAGYRYSSKQILTIKELGFNQFVTIHFVEAENPNLSIIKIFQKKNSDTIQYELYTVNDVQFGEGVDAIDYRLTGTSVSIYDEMNDRILVSSSKDLKEYAFIDLHVPFIELQQLQAKEDFCLHRGQTSTESERVRVIISVSDSLIKCTQQSGVNVKINHPGSTLYDISSMCKGKNLKYNLVPATPTDPELVPITEDYVKNNTDIFKSTKVLDSKDSFEIVVDDQKYNLKKFEYYQVKEVTQGYYQWLAQLDYGFNKANFLLFELFEQHHSYSQKIAGSISQFDIFGKKVAISQIKITPYIIIITIENEPENIYFYNAQKKRLFKKQLVSKDDQENYDVGEFAFSKNYLYIPIYNKDDAKVKGDGFILQVQLNAEQFTTSTNFEAIEYIKITKFTFISHNLNEFNPKKVTIYIRPWLLYIQSNTKTYFICIKAQQIFQIVDNTAYENNFRIVYNNYYSAFIYNTQTQGQIKVYNLTNFHEIKQIKHYSHERTFDLYKIDFSEKYVYIVTNEGPKQFINAFDLLEPSQISIQFDKYEIPMRKFSDQIEITVLKSQEQTTLSPDLDKVLVIDKATNFLITVNFQRKPYIYFGGATIGGGGKKEGLGVSTSKFFGKIEIKADEQKEERDLKIDMQENEEQLEQLKISKNMATEKLLLKNKNKYRPIFEAFKKVLLTGEKKQKEIETYSFDKKSFFSNVVTQVSLKAKCQLKDTVDAKNAFKFMNEIGVERVLSSQNLQKEQSFEFTGIAAGFKGFWNYVSTRKQILRLASEKNQIFDLIQAPFQNPNSLCKVFTSDENQKFVISACKDESQYKIMISNYMSNQPHPIGTFDIDIKLHVSKIFSIRDYIFIIDSNFEITEGFAQILVYKLKLYQRTEIDEDWVEYIGKYDIPASVRYTDISIVNIQHHSMVHKVHIFLTRNQKERSFGNPIAELIEFNEQSEDLFTKKMDIQFNTILDDEFIEYNPSRVDIRIAGINVFHYNEARREYQMIIVFENFHSYEMKIYLDEKCENVIQMKKINRFIQYGNYISKNNIRVTYGKNETAGQENGYLLFSGIYPTFSKDVSQRNDAEHNQILFLYKRDSAEVGYFKPVQVTSGYVFTKEVYLFPYDIQEQMDNDNIKRTSGLIVNPDTFNLESLHIDGNMTLILNQTAISLAKCTSFDLTATNDYSKPQTFTFNYSKPPSEDDDDDDDKVWVIILILAFVAAGIAAVFLFYKYKNRCFGGGQQAEPLIQSEE